MLNPPPDSVPLVPPASFRCSQPLPVALRLRRPLAKEGVLKVVKKPRCVAIVAGQTGEPRAGFTPRFTPIFTTAAFGANNNPVYPNMLYAVRHDNRASSCKARVILNPSVRSREGHASAREKMWHGRRGGGREPSVGTWLRPQCNLTHRPSSRRLRRRSREARAAMQRQSALP